MDLLRELCLAAKQTAVVAAGIFVVTFLVCVALLGVGWFASFAIAVVLAWILGVGTYWLWFMANQDGPGPPSRFGSLMDGPSAQHTDRSRPGRRD